jgi:hypothetical protein
MTTQVPIYNSKTKGVHLASPIGFRTLYADKGWKVADDDATLNQLVELAGKLGLSVKKNPTKAEVLDLIETRVGDVDVTVGSTNTDNGEQSDQGDAGDGDTVVVDPEGNNDTPTTGDEPNPSEEDN